MMTRHIFFLGSDVLGTSADDVGTRLSVNDSSALAAAKRPLPLQCCASHQGNSSRTWEAVSVGRDKREERSIHPDRSTKQHSCPSNKLSSRVYAFALLVGWSPESVTASQQLDMFCIHAQNTHPSDYLKASYLFLTYCLTGAPERADIFVRPAL
jgi:hypothetical protein